MVPIVISGIIPLGHFGGLLYQQSVSAIYFARIEVKVSDAKIVRGESGEVIGVVVHYSINSPAFPFAEKGSMNHVSFEPTATLVADPSIKLVASSEFDKNGKFLKDRFGYNSYFSIGYNASGRNADLYQLFEPHERKGAYGTTVAPELLNSFLAKFSGKPMELEFKLYGRPEIGSSLVGGCCDKSELSHVNIQLQK